MKKYNFAYYIEQRLMLLTHPFFFYTKIKIFDYFEKMGFNQDEILSLIVSNSLYEIQKIWYYKEFKGFENANNDMCYMW